jgi:uncharacterized protein YciI
MRFIAALFLAPLLAATAAPSAGASNADSELRYVVFLRLNPDRPSLPMEKRQNIQDAHMANIRKLADEGILVAAGPMEDTPVTINGIFIFSAPSLAEAERIAALDPSVAAKRNTVDVHPWWGPAGIGAAYFKWKKENPSADDAMASHAFCLVKRGSAQPDSRAPIEVAALVEPLRRAGALSAAGPIEGDRDLLGIIIFKGASVEEARRALERDESVKSGRIAIEYHVWWTADRVLPW